MGEVYAARDTRLNRQVAIKILPQAKLSDPDRRRRFLQEAQAASGLNHPNIITVHDLLADAGGDCLVMEYLTGKTLTQAIQRGGLPLREVLSYGLQVAEALSAAHAAGIVHRDLKPANVMISAQGLVKLLDFGLAKLVAPESTSGDPSSDATQTLGPQTIEGSLLGTINDMFTFGGVMYEMLAGKPPFAGGSQIATLTAILRDEPAAFSEEVQDAVPADLVALVNQCLRKNPADRYQNMGQVRDEIARIKAAHDSGILSKTASQRMAAEVAASAITPPPAPSARPVRGGKTGLWLGLGGFVVVAGMLAAFLWTRAPAPVADTKEPAEAVVANQPPPPPPMPDVLTNESVIEMVKAKLPERFIVSQLRSAKTKFDLSTPELIRLGKSGVSEAVVSVMRDPKAVVAAAPALVAATPVAVAGAPVAGAPVKSTSPAVAPVPVAGPVAGVAVKGADAPVATPTVTSDVKKVPSVTLADGTRVRVMLDEDIPREARPAAALKMSVSENVVVNGRVVIAAGAPLTVTLAIMPGRKLLGKWPRVVLQLESVRAADGRQIRIRSRVAGGASDHVRHPIEAAGLSSGTLPEGVLAKKGTEIYCYVDGDFPL